MTKRIALKIDVDTLRGTLSGVPTLVDILQRQGASASFFFSLGADQSGRENRSTSLKRYYDLSTRLYGRLLPAPNIGKRGKEILRSVADAGFEVGIHAWNRRAWEEKISTAPNAWVESEMAQAYSRFAEFFPDTAKVHAAAGWCMNRHALRLTQRMGFAYASDCRGSHPFIPVIDGEIVDCPQLPTTLPTLDEILALEPDLSVQQATERILQLSCAISGDHVFTLRAELEGMPFAAVFEQLLSGWKDASCQLLALRDIATTLERKDLPRHAVSFGETPGRRGQRMMQGEIFPGH